MGVAVGLAGSDRPLAQVYDVALLDLDGVVYVGPAAVPHAAEALGAARRLGLRLAFVTNNAARTPATVAGHLRRLGVSAATEEVVTSAQAAARVVAGLVPAGARVLVVGGPGLVEALAEHGLVAVTSAEDAPAAVVQGYHPDVGWRSLAEGTYAVNRGLPWVASNTDLTIPTPRGRAPGNGTLVQVVASATGRFPVVAGKPELAMHQEAVRRSNAARPLVVGDRLDTDIEGAVRAGVPSLLVLSGVCDPVELVLAAPSRRPTYLSADLRGLLHAHPAATAARPGSARCGRWQARAGGPAGLHLEVERTERTLHAAPDDGLDALRAACAATWSLSAKEKPDDAQVAAALADAGVSPGARWREPFGVRDGR